MRLWCRYRLQNDPDYFWAFTHATFGTGIAPLSRDVREALVRKWVAERLL